MKKINPFQLFLIGVMVMISIGGHAQRKADPVIIQSLNGTLGQLQVDSYITVEDSRFFDPGYTGLLTGNDWVQNKITLRLNEASPYFLKSGFSASVLVRMSIWVRTDSVEVYDSAFSITYDPTGNTNDRSIFTFHNGYRVEAKIINLTSNVGWDVFSSMILENELQSFPSFIFNCSSNAIQTVSTASLDSLTHLDELPVSWPNVEAANEYDLEWTYIDSAALKDGMYGHPDSLNRTAIFENSTTRVTITNNYYKIPILYDGAGTLFYRVRPVQTHYPYARIEADWSTDYSGGLGSFYFKGHERNLNWQATTSYAEEGKRKVVVQYFDGSLRARQTVTKDNTTDSTIVAESIYDYQGRPVIQVLPTPTLNNIIQYSRNFNSNLSGNPYDKQDFDSLPAADVNCTFISPAMLADSGASRYYSPLNPRKNNGFNRYIPNAHGYPFTQVEYLNDNTGRIARQSGLDTTYRLGSNHETKYYYGTPDQRELDALFGTEVGDYSHYFKTMVRDANGQFSVSYADMHGRTIATALAGNLPVNIKLDTLASKKSKTITETISNPDRTVIKDLVMENKKGLLVAIPDTYSFHYELHPDSLRLEDCSPKTICYDCLYDLRITITGDCNPTSGGEPQPFYYDTVVNNFPLVANDTSLSTPVKYFKFDFTKELQPGSYEITKQLSVSRQNMEYYRDSIFLKTNTCFSFDSMVNKQRQLLASSIDCAPSCASCLTGLGTFSTFFTRYREQAGVAIEDSLTIKDAATKAFTAAQDACNEICSKDKGLGDDQRALMLADLTPPSGQYANLDSAHDTHSIFYGNPDNIPIYKPAYTYFALVYRDDTGKPDTVYNEKTGTYVIPQQLSPEEFARYFKLSWAEALLSYHPEYCKLLSVDTASEHWDRRFAATDTYAEAISRGYLNPLHVIGNAFFTKYNATGTADYDPVTNGDVRNDLEDSISVYRKNTATDTSINMWSMATITAKCTYKDNYCFQLYLTSDSAFNETTTCTGDLDMAWRAFREMYRSAKQALVSREMNAICPSVSALALLAEGHQPHFVDGESLSGQLNTPSNTSQALQQTTDSLNSYYSANCIAYSIGWREQLKDCYSGTALDSIIARMIRVCKEGSDATHPYGASSVRPASTYIYRSFDQIIAAHNQLYPPVDPLTCHPYKILNPKPYDQQAAFSNKPVWTIPDSCECNRIKQLHGNFKTVENIYGTFSAYLLQVYKTSIADTTLNALLSQCTVDPLVASCNYLSAPISLPPVFQCNTGDVCIGCTQFAIHDAAFRQQFPDILPVGTPTYNDTVQYKRNKLYADFMNSKTGFGKTAKEYVDFFTTCQLGDGVPTETCDTLQQILANALYDYHHDPEAPGCQTYFTNYFNFLRGTSYTFAQIDNLYLSQCGTHVTVCGPVPAVNESCYQDLSFVKTYDAAGPGLFYNVKQTADRGYIVVGRTNGYRNSASDATISKMNAAGTIEWAKSVAGPDYDGFTDVRPTADGGYVAIGSTLSYSEHFEVMVLKVDAFGNRQWLKRLNAGTPGGEYGFKIIQLQAGGYVLTGNYSYESGSYLLVTRLDSVGSQVWAKQLGYYASNGPGNVMEVGDSLFVSGITAYGSSAGYSGLLMKLATSSGAVGWTRIYEVDESSNWFYDIYRTASGFALSAVSADNLGEGNARGVMIKIDSSGIPSSVTRVEPATNIETSPFITVYPTYDGGFVAVQGEQSPTDVFLQKTAANGTIEWSNQIKMPGNQMTLSLIQTIDSSYVVVGFTDEASLMIKTNKLGQVGCTDSAIVIDNSSPDIDHSPAPLDVEETIMLTINNMAASFVDYQFATTVHCFNDPCGITAPTGLTLCGRAEPYYPVVDVNLINNCMDSSFFIMSAAIELYKVHTDSLYNRFDSAYRAKCMQAYKYETFTVRHTVSEYHHTLYYYDQAGNLLKTVPPAGVCARYDSLWLDSVKTFRRLGQTKIPVHKMATQYRYNTLNQVIAQQTPDAGKTGFWYDRLGRLVISQNAKQKASSGSETGRHYSYTVYDYLGRIAEVGQVGNAGSTAMADSISRKPDRMDAWLTAANAFKEQITQTVYDTAYGGYLAYITSPIGQRNLRNRVSFTTFTDGNNSSNYNHGTFYSYDIHGNVDTLLQDFGSADTASSTRNHMNATGNRFKKMVYKYDLISGKVNHVAYQSDMPDQMLYRYRYDAENRLVDVETSRDSALWEKDAHYEYYRHGPLARTVYGDQKVQGVDYAYTIQGWLKGVNSTSLNPLFDMGGDGDTARENRYVAKDIYSYGLHYNGADYRPIDSTYNPFSIVTSQLSTSYRPLYNGNISSMTSNLAPLYANSSDNWKLPQLYNYTYDQLNRLTAMDAYYGLDQSTNAWSGMTQTNNYRNRFQYDANGNIQKQVRWGNTGGWPDVLDSMRYVYESGTNRLAAIEDTAIGWAPYRHTFAYDEIGNLIKDSTFNIPQGGIKWNVYGKITDVVTSNVNYGNPSRTGYTYDPSGNRVSKFVTNFNYGSNQIDYTWYVRDASGNIMATYAGGGDSTANKSTWGIWLTAINLYGSSRLGMFHTFLGVNNIGYTNVHYSPYVIPFMGSFARGNKYYELSNHLGNVLMTLYDAKLGVPKASDSSLIASYKALPIVVNDYSPFGMLLPGRDTFDPQYRFGFNGKENDLDFRGVGQITDYGARIYNARLGKFLSMDPIAGDFPWLSPFQYAGNSPIQSIDLDGLEPTSVKILRSLSSVSTKILAGSSSVNYNATTHTVSLANGIAVDKEGNVLAFSSKGGLAATLDFSQGGASSDVSMNFAYGFSIYNDRVTDLPSLLGSGKSIAFGVGLDKFGAGIGASVSMEMGDDNTVVGSTLQLSIGFGTGTPLSVSGQKSDVTGIVYAKAEYDRVFNLKNSLTKQVQTQIEDYNIGQATQNDGKINFAKAIWQADGGNIKLDYEKIGENRYEIILKTSFRQYAQQTNIPANGNAADFKDNIITNTHRTGVILNSDSNGNFISEAYKRQ